MTPPVWAGSETCRRLRPQKFSAAPGGPRCRSVHVQSGTPSQPPLPARPARRHSCPPSTRMLSTTRRSAIPAAGFRHSSSGEFTHTPSRLRAPLPSVWSATRALTTRVIVLSRVIPISSRYAPPVGRTVFAIINIPPSLILSTDSRVDAPPRTALSRSSYRLSILVASFWTVCSDSRAPSASDPLGSATSHNFGWLAYRSMGHAFSL
mmetsp:Transcript_3868/g.8134  ORF Transcript_3868/g.8134 Transcript_3868/m.8134 type:complete len:207 (+) Transcript_3868:190-810(+)